MTSTGFRWRRLGLAAVVAALVATALVAIAVLLFGEFGGTARRVLATTALVAGYAFLTLPSLLLLERRRRRPLAFAALGVTMAALAATLTTVWLDEPPEALGKLAGSLSAFAVAAAQVTALAGWGRVRRDRAGRALYAASSALALALATAVAAVIWADVDSEAFGRAFGVGLVLDVLLVALQPVLALARPRLAPHRVRVRSEEGTAELTVEAESFGRAALRAIERAEREGRHVTGVERADRRPTPLPH